MEMPQLPAHLPSLPFRFAERHRIVAGDLIGSTRTGLPIRHCWAEEGVSLAALWQARHALGACLSIETLPQADFQTQLIGMYHQGAVALQTWSHADAEDLWALAQAIPATDDLLNPAHDAPVIRLINALLSQAIQMGASDVHMEPFAESLHIRFRVDGVLRHVLSPDPRLGPMLVSRIKVMAQLDIAEKRMPQDGRMGLRLGGRAVDVRVSTWPAHHGERVVLRVLDPQAAQWDLGQLGLPAAVLKDLYAAIASPHGMVLVTGPTGSGKTTTLYAMLRAIGQQPIERNILTVEDPIEYDVPGVGQMAVNPKVGLGFADGLRSILRQDPDVVMVGEIRDQETAEVAVQASLTGHLVLSTLHTHSARGAITRLREMGIPPFLLGSTLRGILAQRLLRLLCLQCAEAGQARGCAACGGSGYKGRIGIYEWLPVDAPLRAGLLADEPENRLPFPVRDLWQAGMECVALGKTTEAEVMRVLAERER